MGAVGIGTGFVYAALFEEGYVKIGITRNIEKRMQTLGTQTPHALLRCVYVETSPFLRRTEIELHDLFQDKRVNGEYFLFNWMDWLEWFHYWDNLEYARKSGCLDDLAQFYRAAQLLRGPDSEQVPPRKDNTDVEKN